jgi:lysophospholipase L1-like esterase
VRDLALRLLSDSSLVLLAPVLFVQGRWVRRVTPRLPQAAGPEEGIIGAGAHPIRLLLVGESPAMGVGVSDHASGLVGQTARALADTAGCAVSWRVMGRSGASARNLLDEFIAPAALIDADVVVVVLGVNDTIGLSSPARWIGSLEALLESLRRGAHAVPVVLAAVPPMQYFPAIPSPLRHVLGLRSHVLDRAAVKWARARRGVAHVPHPRAPYTAVSEAFCSDGFHPSAIGYEQWGAALASAAATLLQVA